MFHGRGYTGHEHLTQFGLINMNARLYDAALGRFLSPDPYVQAPDFSQSFNRYSYCVNNPLKYTDENGEFIWIIAGAIIGAYIGGLSSNHGELNPIKWNWKDPGTYLAVGFGAIMGAAGGYWIENLGAFSLGLGINSPWVSAGVTFSGGVFATGTGTDFNWDFHWSTIAGGEGHIDSSNKTNEEDIVIKKPKGDNRFFDGSYYEASEFLSYLSKYKGVEMCMYHTNEGYYFDDTEDYIFGELSNHGLQINYAQWGSREDDTSIYFAQNTINGAYPFRAKMKNGDLYLGLGMNQYYKADGFYHTHPGNTNLSPSDAFQNIVRCLAIGWDGFSRGLMPKLSDDSYLLNEVIIPPASKIIK